MSTFIDPVTIRRLADAGDAFYKGAAWILDQQDAARQFQDQVDATAEAVDQATTRYAFPQHVQIGSTGE